MRDVAASAGSHGSERALAPRVGGVQCDRRCLIVIEGAKPVALRSQYVPALEGRVGALIIEAGDPDPFPIPRIDAIGRVDPAGGKEAFGHHRTALLSCA
jgi:hypothetical protein